MKRFLFIFIILPAVLFSQNNLENKFRLAKIYLQNGETDKAKQILIELNSMQPWNQTYLIELNNAYLSLKEYQSSIDLLTKRIELNPKDISCYGLLGSTYFIMGESEKAYLIWDKAFSVVPVSSNIYRLMANYPIENRAFDKAIEYLKKGQNISGDPNIFSFDLASLYSATMNYKSAAEEYCGLLSSQSQQLEIVKSRLLTFIDRQDATEIVLSVVSNYFEQKKNNEFTELYISLLLHVKKYDVAYNVISELNQTLKLSSERNLNFAKLFLREKAFSIARKTFEYCLMTKDSKIAAEAKIGLAKSAEEELNNKIADNLWLDEKYLHVDSSEALKYREIIKLYEDIEKLYVGSETANEALFRQGEIFSDRLFKYDYALEKYQTLSSKYPSSKFAVEAREKVFLCKVMLNRIEEAEQDILSFSKYPRVTKEKIIAVNFLLAKIKFWQSQFTEALQLLAEVTENMEINEANDAIELSMIINFNISDSLNLTKYAKADLMFAQSKYSEAKSIFVELANNESLVLLGKFAKMKTAEINIAEKDYSKAIATLKEISNEEISFLNDKCAFLLGGIYYFVIKNYSQAEIEFNSLLEKFPNSIYAEKSRDLVNQIEERKKKSL